MVCRKKTFNNFLDKHDNKYIDAKTTGRTLPPGKSKCSDLNLILDFSLPMEAKVKVTITDVRLKLITNKFKKITEKSLVFTNFGFTQSDLGPIDHPPKGYIQKIPGT